MNVQLETVIREVRERGKANANSLIDLHGLEHAAEELDGGRNYRRLRRILLIEDSRDLNEAIAQRLERAGFDAVSAYDGLTGVEMIQREEPDLVLLDLSLPCLSGFKLLHRLRNVPVFGDAPVMILTGDPDPAIEARAAVYGVERVLRKPIRPRYIVDAVRDVLDGVN